MILMLYYNVKEEEQWCIFLESQKVPEEIVSISLQKQLLTEVDFSDDDLLQKWKDYLKTLKIKKHHKRLSKIVI